MPVADRRWFLFGLTAVVLACASGGKSSTRTRERADLITEADIAQVQASNVYDVIEAKRSRWLNVRGTNSLTAESGPMVVYFDGTRLGGVELLKGIPVTGVVYIQYFDPNQATGRWGIGHTQGAIYVSTKPMR
jgi:hypothetical protein